MPSQVRATTTMRGYGALHERRRAGYVQLVLAGRVLCARCGEPILPDQAWDLGHDDFDRSKYTGPEHRYSADCREGGNRATAGRRPWLLPVDPSSVEQERDGLDRLDARWRVPWLRGLRRVPSDATWPRLMTVPHPSAAGSLGAEFVRWAEARSGKPLRWWQRLVATRVLEVDQDGRLVWETVLWSTARQVGKSWLLRELILWRLHQGERFGEKQDVVHTGKDLSIVREIQEPARAWAMSRRDEYLVRLANGDEMIKRIADGSRWMLRAQESVYGYAAALAVVDEAWKVDPKRVDEGLSPTMVERQQPQLYLVSTAHRLATGLMVGRRRVALDELEAGDGDLLIEWSAPSDADLDDTDAWRLASPHWTVQRERQIRRTLERVRNGELMDPDEPDPEQAFRAQWLNQWPAGLTATGDGEELLPEGMWASLTEPGLQSSGPVWVAVEDGGGKGAAVAAAARLPDGRLEVDGNLFPDWDSALAWVDRLGAFREVQALLIGASMLDRVPVETVPPPQPAGVRETRLGLPLLRDLAAGGMLAHDHNTHVLDDAVMVAQVRETTSGLQPVKRGPLHLVKALVWAVGAAHRPVETPAVF